MELKYIDSDGEKKRFGDVYKAYEDLKAANFNMSNFTYKKDENGEFPDINVLIKYFSEHDEFEICADLKKIPQLEKDRLQEIQNYINCRLLEYLAEGINDEFENEIQEITEEHLKITLSLMSEETGYPATFNFFITSDGKFTCSNPTNDNEELTEMMNEFMTDKLEEIFDENSLYRIYANLELFNDSINVFDENEVLLIESCVHELSCQFNKKYGFNLVRAFIPNFDEDTLFILPLEGQETLRGYKKEKEYMYKYKLIQFLESYNRSEYYPKIKFSTYELIFV